MLTIKGSNTKIKSGGIGLDVKNLKDGTIFYGDIGNERYLLLKCYSIIVALNRPDLTWNLWPAVFNFKEVYATLIVEDYEEL